MKYYLCLLFKNGRIIKVPTDQHEITCFVGEEPRLKAKNLTYVDMTELLCVWTEEIYNK